MTINNMYRDIRDYANGNLNFTNMGKSDGKEDTTPEIKFSFDH